MSTRISHLYDNYRRGNEDSRGRQRQQLVASTRRSRSAEGGRPQYKDPRRNFSSPTRASAALYNTHTMPLSEPNFHDLDEMRFQHSRSLSPAYPRRLTATPYDRFLLERQDNDLYQCYAEEAYSQRYAKTKSTKSDRKETTDALLMFNDAFETGSALTGWSEQELLKKRNKNESKRAKGYGKKKKAREARILNIPAALKRTTVTSELPVVMERKRYYRGADGPTGAMSREIVERRTAPIAKPEIQTRSRSWTIAPSFSRSSDMESTQSSSEGPEAVSNAAVRRWMQTKENRKQISDFPLLSTRSFDLASTPKDAPGPVARRPSPDMHDPTRNRFETPVEPIEQLRLSTEKRRHGALWNASASFESEWMQNMPEANGSLDHDRSLRFSRYSGTGLNLSYDVPDDGSPTSVVSSHAFKQRSSLEQTTKDTRKPKSILRNSPRSPSRRVDGTYPMSNKKDFWKDGNENLQRKVQTRFSDKVEQRMYDNNEEPDVSIAEESNYFNNYGHQGNFSLSKNNQANEMDDPFELEKLADELLGRAYSTPEKGYVVGLLESKEHDDNTEISKAPPSDGFVDADGTSLSPIRSEVSGVIDDTIDPARFGTPGLYSPEASSRFQSIDSVTREPREMAPHSSSVAKSRNGSDRHKRSSVPTSAPFEKEDRWSEMDDEDYTITDDEFDNSGELAFIQVVAAVVIQATVRRFLAILTFERLIEAHFKSIAGPDLMDPVVLPQQREAFQDPPERFESTKISKLHRPDPPPQNGRQKLQLLMLSAITIQRIFRGWWVRDSLHVDRYCAILIQRMVRGFLARTNFYYDVYRIILVQSYVRMLLAREIAAERLAAVVSIQAFFRGYLARKCIRGSVSERKFQVAEHVAAIKIQSMCRSFLFHEKYLNTLADILIVQSMARRWIVRTQVMPSLTTLDNFKHRHTGHAGESHNGEPRSPFVDVMNRRMTSPVAVAGFSPSVKGSDQTSRNAMEIFKAENVAFSDSRPGSDDPLSPLQVTHNRIRMVPTVRAPRSGKQNVKSPLSDQTISRSNVEVTARSLSYEEKSAPMQYRPSLAASYEESPQRYRPAVRAARLAVQGEANQVGPDDEMSSAIVSSSRRKVPNNSAAAFWEQKTASQPKPMFPPKGWR